MERAAPAVLVGQHVAVTGRTVALEEGIGSWTRSRQDRAGFAPVEAGVRDHNFKCRWRSRAKTDSGDPVSDADEGRVLGASFVTGAVETALGMVVSAGSCADPSIAILASVGLRLAPIGWEPS